MTFRVEALVEKLSQVRTLEDLNLGIGAMRDMLDVEHIVYHSVNSTGEQYAALTYSPDWVDQYLELDYARIDPVVQACYRRFVPVDWKTLDWSGKVRRDFMGEAISAGIGNQGFSVPIRGPSGQFALFTISDSGSDDDWASYTKEYMPDLILAAHFVNHKALEIERGSDVVEMVSLSPRETDTLRMLALGRSRAQAADAMSISEHTLRAYIESARLKLGALNTTQAVARAIAGGLIVI